MTTPIGDFGNAIRAMKDGARVCRAGWNGKGMWLSFVLPVRENDIPIETAGYVACGDILQGVKRLPWIGMKTAGNEFVPWLASQTDMLAEDWHVLDGEG